MGLNSAIEATLRRQRLLVSSGLAVIIALAWAYMFYLAGEMKSPEMGMEMGPPHMHVWGGVDFMLMFIMWTVMMVAMMTPSAAPMILLFAKVNQQRRQRQKPFLGTGIFLLGYLLVWTGFSAVVTLAQWGLHSSALLSPMMVSTSPVLAGTLLIAAGIFQFTPLKNACLVHCQSPLGFFMTKWREGIKGALIMGIRHGSYCLGCCWLLMLLLFVAGVMNLVWVAIITAVVLVEKIAPVGHWVSPLIGLIAFGWGTQMLFVFFF